MRHPVVTLLFKIALLIVPFALLFYFTSFRTPDPNTLQHIELENKVQKVLLDASTTPQVIVSGDSRAQDNFVPAVFTQLSGLSSVNIGVGYGLLAQEYDALKADNQLNKKRLIIVSVGIYDINDGGENADLSVINSEPNSLQKFADIFNYYAGVVDYYFYRFGGTLRFSKGDNTLINPGWVAYQGYEPQTAVFIPPQGGGPNPPGYLGWYTDVRLGGVVQQNFVRAIQELGATNDTIVIYLGPVAPFAKPAMHISGAWQTDQQLVDLINKTIAPYPNISFSNFEGEDTSAVLPNDKFGDYFHLNQTGTPLFTKLLYETLKDKKLIK